MSPPAARQPLRLAVGPVAVTFLWADDRWAHEIAIDGRVVWASDEGPRGGDDRWPASPPLTELVTTGTDRGTALVGVGRAGRSHFSASFAADAARADRVRVEIACRVVETPGWLGSTYRASAARLVVQPRMTVTTPPETVVWAYAIGPDGLAPLADSLLLRPDSWPIA